MSPAAAPQSTVRVVRGIRGPFRLLESTLRAVEQSTLMQLYRDDRSACGDIAALVRRLPCWRMELGGGLDAVPGLLRRHLDSC